MFNIGDKVEKIKGYPFRGTVLATFTKVDEEVRMCVVEIEPGPNAAGLVYLHPESVLRLINDGQQ